ncbi:MAG: ABC transporter permease [Thaumarchaeota archaeon]|nr:ABC transporter permease [Candidatus Terraquivivens yellowstonensis]
MSLKNFLRENIALLMIFPAIILIFPLFLIPLASILIISLFKYSPLQSLWIPEFTIENYTNVVTSPLFIDVLISTIRIAVAVMVLSLILGYPIAYYIARSPSNFIKRTLLIISVLTFFMSWVPRLFAWIIILGKYGVINTMLRLITEEPIKLLGTDLGIIIGLTHAMTPLTALILINPIKNIDLTLEESAKSLGADNIQTFFKITLPLSLPGIISALILTYSVAVSAFITPMMLGQGITLMMSNYVYTRFGETLNFPLGATLAVVLLTVALTTSYIINLSLGKLVKVR